MNKPPFYAEFENAIASAVNPSGVTVSNTKTACFFRRYLLMKAMSVFEWTLPKSWSEEYFLYTLYGRGHIGIVKTDKFGVICQGGTPGGINVFYQPNKYIIANPLIKGGLSPIIDKECVVFKLAPDWGGILDLVALYGDYMALAAEACGVNLINSHLAYIFLAENKSVAESFKKLYDDIASGKPASVVDNKLTNNNGELAVTMLQQNLKQNFISLELLETWRNLENMFATAIGIPNANTDKKERMIVDEVNANNVETMCTVDMWFTLWKKSCVKVKEMFKIDIDVKWRVDPLGGFENEKRNADNFRIV